MDSAGVHAIIDANGRARRGGHHLVLVRGPACVHRLFALTGTAGDLLILDLDPAEPPVKVLLGRPTCSWFECCAAGARS